MKPICEQLAYSAKLKIMYHLIQIKYIVGREVSNHFFSAKIKIHCCPNPNPTESRLEMHVDDADWNPSEGSNDLNPCKPNIEHGFERLTGQYETRGRHQLPCC